MKWLFAVLALLLPLRAYSNEPDCPIPSYCTDELTHPVFSYTFDVVNGTRYVVSTSDLTTLPGSIAADTVIWVVNLDTKEIVGINDDYSGLASRVEFTAASSFSARGIIGSYKYDRYGTADVSIQEDSTEILPVGLQQDQEFGGYTRPSFHAEPGDAIFVGPLGPNTYSTTAYLFSTISLNCTSGCGTVDVPVLSTFRRIDVSSSVTGRLLVAALPFSGGTRMIHSRLSGAWPSDPEFEDLDDDGLTSEIEEQLGTCDSASGPSPDCDPCTNDVFPADCPAGTCKCFARRHTTYSSEWSPADTDGDGISDLNEVFQMVLACSNSPMQAPYFLDTCDDRTRLSPACPSSYGVCYYVPVSSLDTDPTEYDVLIELDTVRDATGAPQFPSAEDMTAFKYMYDGEGMECEENTSTNIADCPAERLHHRRIRLHTIFDQAFMPGPTVDTYFTRLEFSNVYFNKWFTNFRKQSGLYRYGLSLPPAGAGEAQIVGNQLVSTSGGSVLPHELGHSLGLKHGGNIDYSGKRNYPSLMGWAYYQRPKKATPGQTIWPADLGNCCVTDATCSNPLVCDPWSGATCSPNPASLCDLDPEYKWARFSRGFSPPLYGDTGILEAGYGPKFAANVRAFWDLKGRDYYQPICNGGSCSIDWNGDSTYAGSPLVDLDQDGNFPGDPDDNTTDFDDWPQMYGRGRDGLAESSFKRDIRVYSTSFDFDARDYSGWGQVPTLTKSGWGDAGSPDSGWYVTLDGVDDGFSLADTPASQAMGVTLDDIAPDGFRIDLMFNLDAVTTSTTVYLIDSQLVRITLAENAGANNAVVGVAVHSGVTWGSTLSYGNPVQPGVWYWVQADWDRSRVRLRVIPWDSVSGVWDDVNGSCVDSELAAHAERSPGSIAVAQTVSGTRHFKGKLDEVRIWASTPCQDFFKSIGCPADLTMNCKWCPYVGASSCPEGGL